MNNAKNRVYLKVIWVKQKMEPKIGMCLAPVLVEQDLAPAWVLLSAKCKSETRDFACDDNGAPPTRPHQVAGRELQEQGGGKRAKAKGVRLCVIRGIRARPHDPIKPVKSYKGREVEGRQNLCLQAPIKSQAKS